ncbi:MAG: HAD family phosphatase [Endomicrobia bacterium]|nr:HAD family phosphatase [Endomicrobiia bacterium]MCL2506312.1 HAD family phosphatase [Endomicrobiia bacterium]
MKVKKFKTVLFDMDGVVVDTMPYHFISWFEVLKRYGVRISPMTIFEMEGAKWDAVIKLAYEQSGKKLAAGLADKIRFEREKIFKKYFNRYIFDGISEFIKSLKKQGVLVGLVTGSSLKEAKRFLPKELYSMFNVVVAGDMIKRSKPYPDPYLTAAKQLDVLSKECVVIENAPYGIKSAKAAKMYCIALATSLPKDKLLEADRVFNTHKELYKYFDKNS